MQYQTIDHVLRATWQAVAKMYNEEAAKYGATMATGLALLSIDAEDGVPSTSLGPRMGMEATSLSRTLKSMEEKGLVRREPNPEDGRGVLIKLTQEGLEKRKLSKSLVKKFNQAIEKTITESELKAFHKVADVIMSKLEDKSTFTLKEMSA
ncbi:MAG: MarR family transcriptional regulator [Flavobacteriaceae bacterium]|jgi:DNA-binding MarR family transcriptional regulator|nr:MarR family transcriptional regulator [Flavobacteriaceae bacterium]